MTDDVDLRRKHSATRANNRDTFREDTRIRSAASTGDAALKQRKWSVTGGKPEAIQWEERHSRGAEPSPHDVRLGAGVNASSDLTATRL